MTNEQAYNRYVMGTVLAWFTTCRGKETKIYFKSTEDFQNYIQTTTRLNPQRAYIVTGKFHTEQFFGEKEIETAKPLSMTF